MSIFLDVKKTNTNGYTLGFIFETYDECFAFIKTLVSSSRESLLFVIEEITEG